VTGVTCDDFRRFVDAHLDGELDLVRQAEMDEHLRSCAACSRLAAARQSLGAALRSEELYFRAPARLEQKVRAAARQGDRPRVMTPSRIGAALAAAAVLVAAMFLWPPGSARSWSDRTAQDVVSAHVRSLMPGHLTDVPSSEQHTVRPWFAGKLEFAPPVVDLAADGFALVGGRLDYVAGKRVAALVYRRGAHLVNLFAWPAPPRAGETRESESSRDGYNIVRWTRGGTEFWTISDANAGELRSFAALVRARVP
jgi:anti-sigma factor RsiW